MSSIISLWDLKILGILVVEILIYAHLSQRNFGFLSLLGFSCTVLVTWEGTLL